MNEYAKLKEYFSGLSDREFLAVYNVLNSSLSVVDCISIANSEMLKRVNCWFGDSTSEE